jgi:hypothetical protein
MVFLVCGLFLFVMETRTAARRNRERAREQRRRLLNESELTGRKA